MGVRKRQWNTASGEEKEAWVVDFFSGGKRRHETFASQGEAKKRAAQVTLEKANGTHVVIDGKTTVAAAADKWLKYLGGEGRERATIEQYRSHLDRHILPMLGRKHIRKLDTDMLESFRAHLLSASDDEGKAVRTRVQAGKVWITLKSLLKHSRLGHLGQGVKSITVDSRTKRKLKIGVDVPTNDEIKRLFLATAGDTPPAQAPPRAVSGGGLLWIAGIGIAGLASGRCRSRRGRAPRDAACGQIQHDRRSEDRIKPPHRTVAG